MKPSFYFQMHCFAPKINPECPAVKLTGWKVAVVCGKWLGRFYKAQVHPCLAIYCILARAQHSTMQGREAEIWVEWGPLPWSWVDPPFRFNPPTVHTLIKLLRSGKHPDKYIHYITTENGDRYIHYINTRTNLSLWEEPWDKWKHFIMHSHMNTRALR